MAIIVQAFDGGDGVAGVPEVAVRIVLQHQYAVPFAHFQQLLPSLHRHGAARRVLERGDGVDELRAVADDFLFQRVHDHAVFVHVHADDFGFVGVERLQRAEERGRFGEDDVARVAQHFGGEADALRRAGHDDDLVGRSLDAALRRHLQHGVFQAADTRRAAVLQYGAAVFAQEVRSDLRDVFRGKALGRGVAARERYHSGLADQCEYRADGAARYIIQPFCEFHKSLPFCRIVGTCRWTNIIGV